MCYPCGTCSENCIPQPCTRACIAWKAVMHASCACHARIYDKMRFRCRDLGSNMYHMVWLKGYGSVTGRHERYENVCVPAGGHRGFCCGHVFSCSLDDPGMSNEQVQELNRRGCIANTTIRRQKLVAKCKEKKLFGTCNLESSALKLHTCPKPNYSSDRNTF